MDAGYACRMGVPGFIRELVLHRDRVETFDAYPYCIPAIRSLHTLPLCATLTIFVGENGTGKSTFLEAIARLAGLDPEGGSRGFHRAPQAPEAPLHEAMQLIRSTRRERSAFFLRAETMFNLATEVNELGLAEYGWEDLHTKSHGEAFLWTVQNRLHGNGLYVFDEPESALSPQRQLSLLVLLHDLASRGAQIVMATHSPILMAYPGALIYELTDTGIAEAAYEQLESVNVMRNFLASPERMLQALFAPA